MAAIPRPLTRLVDGRRGMRHHVKLVEGDLGVGQVFTHALDEGGRHIR